MSKQISSSARRILALSLVTYFVLPMLPGVIFTGNFVLPMLPDVTFTGNFGSALVLSVAISVGALIDLSLASLAIWWCSVMSGGSFWFDFKMETRSPFSPFFLTALFLTELPVNVRWFGVLSFDGRLPVLASALTMALAILAVSWLFDTILFNLNIDRNGARPRGKKFRVPPFAAG